MTQLPYMTRHFSLAELLITNTGLDNWPSELERHRLRKLAQHLERIREACGGRALIVHSAYRSEAVNRAVGGSKTSAHRLGYAADISCHRMSSGTLANIVRNVGGFDQLIWETGRGIVHVSIDPRLRGQVMTQHGGPGTPMTPGLDYAYWTRRFRPAANDN